MPYIGLEHVRNAGDLNNEMCKLSFSQAGRSGTTAKRLNQWLEVGLTKTNVDRIINNYENWSSA